MSPTPPRPDPNLRSGPIRVMVADDHVTVLEGLVAILGRQPDIRVVAQAGNGREAVALWRQHRPDVTLLDLRMPLLDGIAALAEIRAFDEGARAIVLTTFDADIDVANAVRAGARAYLLKDAPREELLGCIRRVFAGETYLSPPLVAKLAACLSSEALTPRELEVLAHLACGESNKEISTRLSISETTVKAHLRAIFGKLNVLSRTEAISVASRRGLIQIR